MSEDDPILICCPYCIRSLGTIDAPDGDFALPKICRRCGSDPRNDAPVELSLSAWGRLPKKACPACGESVPTLATRCGHCKASTAGVKAGERKTAGAKKRGSTKKSATKKSATKKSATKKSSAGTKKPASRA